jgi:hypothetical protein
MRLESSRSRLEYNVDHPYPAPPSSLTWLVYGENHPPPLFGGHGWLINTKFWPKVLQCPEALSYGPVIGVVWFSLHHHRQHLTLATSPWERGFILVKGVAKAFYLNRQIGIHRTNFSELGSRRARQGVLKFLGHKNPMSPKMAQKTNQHSFSHKTKRRYFNKNLPVPVIHISVLVMQSVMMRKRVLLTSYNKINNHTAMFKRIRTHERNLCWISGATSLVLFMCPPRKWGKAHDTGGTFFLFCKTDGLGDFRPSARHIWLP